MRRDAFYSIHPAVNAVFFAMVMLITCLVMHPVIVGISLVSACSYTVILKGRKALLFDLAFVLPFIVIVAVMNPLFNHEGVTVLFYLWNGNAVTKEAVLYGLVSVCMFAALIMWFYCLNSVMTADKYVYLFGRAIPVLSLVFSMVLRFVPRIFKRISEVSRAQRSIAPPAGKSAVKAARHGMSVLSVTVTWALESAVNISDSMRSRGYGLKGRTSFSIYRFEKRDAVMLAGLLAVFALSAAAIAAKHIRFRFYPSIKYAPTDALSVIGFIAFALLCTAPVLLNIKENILWRLLKSRI